jgi:delta 1-pyrroline-5-carboxylate dehydrogenase
MQFPTHIFTVFLVAFLAACNLALADPAIHTTLSLHVGVLYLTTTTEFL